MEGQATKTRTSAKEETNQKPREKIKEIFDKPKTKKKEYRPIY